MPPLELHFLSLPCLVTGGLILLFTCSGYLYSEIYWTRGLFLTRRALALMAGVGVLLIGSGFLPVHFAAAGLPLGLAVCIAIVQSARTSITRPASTPRADEHNYLFVGDTGTGGRNTRALADQMARWIDKEGAQAVFLLGDNVLGSTPFSIAVLDRFFEPFRSVLERQVPFYAILGNHDHSAGRVESELKFKPFHMEGKSYYQVQADDRVAFFVLDATALRESREQADWLSAELSKSKCTWNVLLFHEPMVCGKFHHGPNKKALELLMPIMQTPPGIDLVLSGHNHVYERRRVHEGIQHLTVGSGGKLSRKGEFHDDPDRVKGFKNRAFLAARFDSNRIQLFVIDQAGEELDSFSLVKCEAGVHAIEE